MSEQVLLAACAGEAAALQQRTFLLERFCALCYLQKAKQVSEQLGDKASAACPRPRAGPACCPSSLDCCAPTRRSPAAAAPLHSYNTCVGKYEPGSEQRAACPCPRAASNKRLALVPGRILLLPVLVWLLHSSSALSCCSTASAFFATCTQKDCHVLCSMHNCSLLPLRWSRSQPALTDLVWLRWLPAHRPALQTHLKISGLSSSQTQTLPRAVGAHAHPEKLQYLIPRLG